MFDGEVIVDEVFGPLKWNEDAYEWRGFIHIEPHQEPIGLDLPPDYVASDDVRAKIRAVIPIIQRDELSFREDAADEIYVDDGHLLFWPEDEPFDRDVFAREMHLGTIVFDTEFPEQGITLWYECGDIVEHVLVVFLNEDGQYQHARDM